MAGADLSDNLVMLSREPFLLAAWLLLALLCNLLMFVVGLLVMFVGPIASLVGWVAMVRRLQSENPDHPLMQGSWNERLGDGHPGILGIYFRTYGLDDNAALAIAGMVATIPGFYLASLLVDLSSHLLKSIGLGL